MNIYINKVIGRSLALLLCFFAMGVSAQEYKDGELIVKFKPTSSVQAKMKGRKAVSGLSKVDQVFAEIGVTEVHALFTDEAVQRAGHKVRANNGMEITVPNVSKTHHIVFDADKSSVAAAVARLQMIDEVEFAEPNYIVTAFEDGEEEVTFDDPMLSEQTYLWDVNLPWLWQQPLIDRQFNGWGSQPVIAIMDTGVDPEHPDNRVDYWSSWDFVLSEDPQQGTEDRNGHGTHCAGIAAATGNNGIGIVGANPDANIHSHTVLQANGKGDVAAIIKALGIYTRRCDVISMSFGMYATSKAFEEALISASESSILVAAAGNDGEPIDKRPCFPAAYSFVIGVWSPDAGFSNSDDDPVLSTYAEGYNYEVKAPGMNILSTYPGDTYRKLSGTSMACPLVAGLISRLLQTKEYISRDQLVADLIHTSGMYVDAKAAYLVDDSQRKPHLHITKVETSDANMGDGNGMLSPGETVEITPSVINYWGTARGITLSAELQENEDPDIVEFIDNNVEFGSALSDYAEATSVNPLRIKLSPACTDGRVVCLRIRAHVEGAEDAVIDYELKGDNGVEIGGLISEDMTLRAGVKYVASRDVYVNEGVTLTAEPGTRLVIRGNTSFYNHGHLDWHGTPEAPIIVTAEDMDNFVLEYQYQTFDTGEDEITYTKFKDWVTMGSPDFRGNYSNCEFRNITLDSYGSLSFIGTYKSCNIVENSHLLRGCFYFESGTFIDTNIAGNDFTTTEEYALEHPEEYVDLMGVKFHSFWNDNKYISCSSSNIMNNSIFDKITCLRLTDTGGINSIPTLAPCYFGSNDLKTVKDHILDADNYYMDKAWSDFSLDVSDRLDRPSAQAPGIVWKVVVNGYNAQDEYDMLPPLGLGRHKFEVYFNRPMNKDVKPLLTMGVNKPYTQKEIAEDGEWNEDGTIYTAYITLDAKSNIDGINRIRVYGAEDLEHFVIPEEHHRFNANIQVAASLSTSLETVPGINNITLRWKTEDAPDLMGYNLYWVNPAEGTEVKRVNQYVLDGSMTEYTFNDLSSAYTYTFYVKEVRTDLVEYDMSNLATATPLPLIKGDANESQTVDVADIVTDVEYIMGHNPEPFSLLAADVNEDGVINVQDVVGTINIILSHNSAGTMYNWFEAEATAGVHDGTLWVNSSVPVAGIQVRLKNSAALCVLGTLDAFEHIESDGQLIAYSLKGEVLSLGRHELAGIGDARIESIVLCDVHGRRIPVSLDDETGITAPGEAGGTNVVYDVLGRRVRGSNLPKGIYIINSKKYIRK